MTNQPNPKQLPLSAEIIEIERNKNELNRIRESLDFAMQTVNELVAMFEPKITKNVDGTNTDENPLSLDTKEMQQLKINSLVVELDKLTQQEIFNLIEQDFPELQLQINELSTQIKNEVNKLGIDIKENNFNSVLEKGQKKINTREKLIYFNSTASIMHLALVFMSFTATPILSISVATFNLFAMLNGENGKRKLANILEIGKKRLKEILAQKILEKYNQKNTNK